MLKILFVESCCFHFPLLPCEQRKRKETLLAACSLFPNFLGRSKKTLLAGYRPTESGLTVSSTLRKVTLKTILAFFPIRLPCWRA